MLGLEVVSADCGAKRGEVASLGLRALYEALDRRAEERPGATRWLQQVQGPKIAISGVPGQVEQYLDHPSAGEHLAVVLAAGGCNCHRYTLETSTYDGYADTAQGVHDNFVLRTPTGCGPPGYPS
jgi:hypothetical protein